MVFWTKAGRWETTQSPRPNFLPSEEMRRMMSRLLALPKPFSGQKLWASSMMQKKGGIFSCLRARKTSFNNL